MDSPTHILTRIPYLFSLFLIQRLLSLLQLFPSLPGIMFFCFWFLVLFCIHKPIQICVFLLYVVDVMERASTSHYSSNRDWNQL